MSYTKGAILAVDIDSEDRFVMRVTQADAPLFKAAPDMYEALRSIRDFRVEYRRVTDDVADWPILNRMNNALAKAEGKEKK